MQARTRIIEDDSHIDRYENDFLWLADADVGLLTYQMGMDVVRQMLGGRPDINYGAIYENFVAQELVAHGVEPFYFKNQAMGELDFVVQWPFGQVMPVEVKSGKGYTRHSALNKVLATENYGIERALVLCEGNIEVRGNMVYAPAYLTLAVGGPAGS